MKIFINNCFHWVGFHILDHLLLHGYQIFGFHDPLTEKEEFLSLFLGRHSKLRQLKKIEGEYDLAIIMNGRKEEMDIHSRQSLLLMTHHEDFAVKNSRQFPLLFGEWMQMNQEGIYVGKEHILFNSSRFLKNAIYIQTYVDQLLQYIKEIEHDLNDQALNMTRKDTLFNPYFDEQDHTFIQEKVHHLITHQKSYPAYYHQYK